MMINWLLKNMYNGIDIDRQIYNWRSSNSLIHKVEMFFENVKQKTLNKYQIKINKHMFYDNSCLKFKSPKNKRKENNFKKKKK